MFLDEMVHVDDVKPKHIESADGDRRAYGHYPERVLADKIFRTRENLRYCKSKEIRMNGPRLGKPAKDPKVRKQEQYLGWLESGERCDIERQIGVNKRCYSLGDITAKLKNTSETMNYLSVLMLNLQKRLRLLLRFFCALFTHSSCTAARLGLCRNHQVMCTEF